MMSKILISMLERENESLKDSLRTAEQERDQYKAQLQECAQLIGEMQVSEHQKHLELESLRAKIKEAQEPVAVIGSTFLLCWIGNGPIAPIIEKHNLKVGDKLYASPAIPD